MQYFLGALILGFHCNLVSSHWLSGCQLSCISPYASDPLKYRPIPLHLFTIRPDTRPSNCVSESRRRGKSSISHHDTCHTHKNCDCLFICFSVNFCFPIRVSGSVLKRAGPGTCPPTAERRGC